GHQPTRLCSARNQPASAQGQPRQNRRRPGHHPPKAGGLASMGCAVQLADAVWVLHAFQKKSKTGIKTPQQEVDTVHTRLKRLREELS
ncbi:MAG: hypothetical protein FGM23_08180, partial [Alphaproteobacteria bacterium]|nr:hypothetical protein [Alphaproteobacteria bacterium]